MAILAGSAKAGKDPGFERASTSSLVKQRGQCHAEDNEQDQTRQSERDGNKRPPDPARHRRPGNGNARAFLQQNRDGEKNEQADDEVAKKSQTAAPPFVCMNCRSVSPSCSRNCLQNQRPANPTPIIARLVSLTILWNGHRLFTGPLDPLQKVLLVLPKPNRCHCLNFFRA
jgi:hypothetical protein